MCEHASRLAHLRAHTKAAHHSIETVPALARLMNADLRRSEYEGLLAAMHAFHLTTEPEIAMALEGLPEAQALLDGTRLRALADDLAFLGVSPMQARPASLPLPTRADAIGALYVVEGASLGGRVIARHIADSLALAPGQGASFYGGMSAETARARWARLCAVLEDPAVELAPDDLARGACKTFEAMERWMRLMAAAQPQHTLAVRAAA
jgi:hypothetical protein